MHVSRPYYIFHASPPEDKQRRYHWISQLLKVCDYLTRDENRSVLRLEVRDSPQIVLASLDLLSTLLGCCKYDIVQRPAKGYIQSIR